MLQIMLCACGFEQNYSKLNIMRWQLFSTWRQHSFFSVVSMFCIICSQNNTV